MQIDLFLIPFLTGLCFSIVLPILGAYLRMREEWLAALAYSHVAAAGALLGLVINVPPAVGGMVFAGLAAFSKRFAINKLARGASYPLFLIGGWAGAVLLAANHPSIERFGHGLFDGQLFFSNMANLGWALVFSGMSLLALWKMASQLLLAHVYPDFFRARTHASWSAKLGFDLLTALLLALATMSMGVMGVFALIFIPSWVAFRRASNWRYGLRLATGLGVSGYVIAFLLALTFDQPFGPTLAVVLITIGLVIA